MYYECWDCKTAGIKLWRQAGASVELKCLACLGNTLGIDISCFTFRPGVRNWVIGNWIPAVPVSTMAGQYWGYYEDKAEAYRDWMDWYKLPTKRVRTIAELWISGHV